MSTALQTDAPRAPERLLVRPLRRLLTWAPDVDGRIVLLAAVAVYLAVIAAGRRVWGVDLWPMLGVPSGPSLFFDARNLTAAWECERLGCDPLYDNPCDPRGRPLMYLRPWLLLGVLGLDQSHTVVVAAVLVGAMFLAFCALAGRVPAGTGIVLAARRVLAGSHVRRRASEHGHRALLGAGGLRSSVAGIPGRGPGREPRPRAAGRHGEDLSGPSRCRRSSSRAAGWRPGPRWPPRLPSRYTCSTATATSATSRRSRRRDRTSPTVRASCSRTCTTRRAPTSGRVRRS